jgi:hypothetical protein
MILAPQVHGDCDGTSHHVTAAVVYEIGLMAANFDVGAWPQAVRAPYYSEIDFSHPEENIEENIDIGPTPILESWSPRGVQTPKRRPVESTGVHAASR